MFGSGVNVLRLWAGSGVRLPALASGDHAEQVAVGLGAQDFYPAAIAMQKTCRERLRFVKAIFKLKPIKRGQGDAVSAIEVSQGFKDFGSELVVAGLWYRFGMLGRRLRGWIGACSFTNSHHLPPCKAGVG